MKNDAIAIHIIYTHLPYCLLEPVAPAKVQSWIIYLEMGAANFRKQQQY